MAAAVAETIGASRILNSKDAIILQKMIDDIQKTGPHTLEGLREELIRRSKPKNSPTHHMFEWDPAKGHALYLIERARALIMCISVRFDALPNVEFRKNITVTTAEGRREYVPMSTARHEKYMQEQLLAQATAALLMWENKYKMLMKLFELQPAFEAIQKVKKRVQGAASKARPMVSGATV